MKVISITNLKGGCAKTTTATAMAELLANGDRKVGRPGVPVLLFDNDPQGNASRLFDAYEGNQEAAACRIIKTSRAAGNILHTSNPKIDIIPCNYFMELAEMEIKEDKERTQHDRYRKALAEVGREYAYCIIDNPPHLGMNVINAIVASDEIIIPVNLDSYSLDGLEELVAQIDQIKALNRKARLAGCLITDAERTQAQEAAEAWLRTQSGFRVFTQKIRHSKCGKDATFYKRTIIQHSIRSGAAQDYKQFVNEYIARTAAGKGNSHAI